MFGPSVIVIIADITALRHVIVNIIGVEFVITAAAITDDDADHERICGTLGLYL